MSREARARVIANTGVEPQSFPHGAIDDPVHAASRLHRAPRMSLPTVQLFTGSKILLAAATIVIAHCAAHAPPTPRTVANAHRDAGTTETTTEAALVAAVCPSLVEARCRMLAHCACTEPANECLTRERTRCEAWLIGTNSLLAGGQLEGAIDRGAVERCVRESLASIAAPLACHASSPARICMNLLEPVTPTPAEASVESVPLSRGARCDYTGVCAAGLARIRGACERVDRCEHEDDDCGHGMRCAPAAHACEPLTCEPFRFWNPDMADS